MTSVERTLLHDRLGKVESENLALTAQLAAQRDINLALVRELERVAADLALCDPEIYLSEHAEAVRQQARAEAAEAELAREKARLDWLSHQEAVSLERMGDGWRLTMSNFRDHRAYHAATLTGAIDRAGGESG